MADKKKIVFGAASGIALAVGSMLTGLYKVEGDYSNHAADRGGATRFGVTEKVARADGYKGDMRVFPKNCFEGEKNTCADKIYYENYIVKPGFVPVIQLSGPVGEELFGSSVNFGPVRPSKWYQTSINSLCGTKLTVDGKLGAGTHAGAKACQVKLGKKDFCIKMLDSLDAQQKARYYAIVAANPSQKVFIKGWLAHRIGNVDRKRCVN